MANAEFLRVGSSAVGVVSAAAAAADANESER